MLNMYTVAMYGMLLHILHTFYTLVQIILDACDSLVNFVKNFLSTDGIELLKLETKSSEKSPNHVVFILGNEEPSFKDLANIVSWCVVAGVPFLTFYDHNGTLKKNQDKFYEVVRQANVKYSTETTSQKLPAGYKNGIQAPIRLNIISLADGQGGVAEFAKECARNNLKDEDIAIDYVNEQLKEKLGKIPDPDLALYCGKVCSTYGFLPWHIRFTEFIDIVSHRGIGVNTFRMALRRYRRCEQRCGK